MDTLKRDLSRVVVLAAIFLGALTAPLWVSGLTQKGLETTAVIAEPALDAVSAELTRTTDQVPQLAVVDRHQPTLLAADGAVDYANDPAAREPEYFPRPADEWQGMLVDMNMRALCSETSMCGLGQTCNDEGLCSACSSDMQCMTGEMCVLDHCVPEQNISCQSSSQCGEGELCALSGYSADLRGTASTRSYCLADTGGQPAEALQDSDYDKSDLPEEEADADFQEAVDIDAVVVGQIIRPETVRQRLEVKTLSSSDLPDRLED